MIMPALIAMSDTPHTTSARSLRSKLLSRALRFGFRQFYTNFAWTYDAVAATVSLREWKAWGRTAIQFLDPRMRILEVAVGPGHLQLALRQSGYSAVGIDLSPQMCALAANRLRRAGLSNTIARGSVFTLPFAADSFDAVVSTFPTEYIYAEQMHHEVWRVLRPGGRLIVVSTAALRNAVIRAVMRLTSTTPSDLPDVHTLFESEGFTFAEHQVPTPRADVFVWLIQKPAAHQQLLLGQI